jgi:hypothetical protein
MLQWRGPEGGVWEGLIDGSTHQFVAVKHQSMVKPLPLFNINLRGKGRFSCQIGQASESQESV